MDDDTRRRLDAKKQELSADCERRAARRSGNGLDYVQAGWHLTPIPHGEKGPTSKSWNQPGNAVTTVDQAKRLNGTNVGLLHVPSRTCAIDIDDLARSRRLLAKEGIDIDELLDARNAVRIESGRPGRAKLIYKLPDGVAPESLVTRKLGQGAYELRCAATTGLSVQDVLPPSTHPTGGRYTWAGSGNWRHPPPLPEALLGLWQRVLTGEVPSSSSSNGGSWTEGERHTRLNAEGFRLRKQGATPESIEKILITVNDERCIPPLPKEEVASIARSKSGIAPDIDTDWPEPQPILNELKPVPAFDAPALLPETLRAFVLDEADRMAVPADFIAAPLVVALGSVIGARVALKVKQRDDWIIVANVWGGVVGDPASKKSPAIAAVTRHLDRAEKQHADRIADEMPVFRAEMAAYEAQRSAVELKLKKATATEDPTERDKLVEDTKAEHAKLRAPEEPHARRFKTNDTTVEKLGALLVDNPAGLLVYRDELVGLLSGWEREGHESDRTFYLEGWTGTNSFAIDRIGRGSTLIPNHCLSILGGVQPELLTRYLAGIANSLDNDGRIQRFSVLVYPDPQSWTWRDTLPDKDAREAIREVFDRLSTFDPLQDGADPPTDFVKLPYLSFHSEAQELFIAWSAELHKDIAAETDPLLAQHLSKFEKTFGAIALIAHLAAGHVGPVTIESARYAQAWCTYLAAHARRIYGLIEAAKVNSARTLGRRLSEGKLFSGFTTRDVVKKGWSGLTTTATAEQALAVLEEHGWVASIDVPSTEQGGRPSVHFCINPQVSPVLPVPERSVFAAQTTPVLKPAKPA